MRIIEPQRKNKTKLSLKLIVFVFVIIGTITLFSVIIFENKDKKNGVVSTNSQSSKVDTNTVLGNKAKIQQYSNQQFKDIYESTAFPNTKELLKPPEITGIVSIDNQIQNEAEKRGYKLRSIADLPIAKTSTNDDLQQKAVAPWEEMKNVAKQDGITLKILAGFRSVEQQRALFINELNKYGFSTTSTVNNNQAINKALNRVAPPGYSRHHTGYTIDISCPNEPNYIFEKSTCFAWLSKNNYENTKKFGWIPSYPKGADMQGPEPEPWEYVWVGL